MNKRIFLSAVLLFSVFILSACGVQNKSGDKVDISSKNENITVESGDGKTQISAGGQVNLPENWPKELMVTNDHRIVMSTTVDKSSSVTFTTDLLQNEVKEKYVSNLTSGGWKKISEVNIDDGMMINFTKEKMNVVITIGANKEEDYKGNSFVSVVLVTE